jgi:hypothetical protein
LVVSPESFIKNSFIADIRFTIGIQHSIVFRRFPQPKIMITKRKQQRPDSSSLNFLRSLLFGAMGFLMACSITACGKKNVQISSQEWQGSKEERIEKITKLLSKSTPLPGPLLDAHFVEEKTGDGRLGPSDFESFYALTIATADLPAWKAALSKSKPANTFSNAAEIKRAAPSKAEPWWVTEADLGKLEFYSPQSLTGNANGWVGMSADGKIYVHVFTM